MRLDHIAYRVKNRNETAKFFKESFGYTLQEEFEIKFDDGSTAKCIALEPPEKLDHRMPFKFGVQVVEQKTTESVGEKLDKLYDVMNHIRWIGLSIGCMLAITFFTPQCSGL